MKKAYSTTIIALFMALLLFFTSFSVFGKKKDFSEKENRALQTLPELSFYTIDDGSFQEEYNEYLSDQFEFRDFWVKAKTFLMRSLGKKDINGIYIGNDDYLIEKYTAADFDAETVDYNTEVLTAFLNSTAQSGVRTTVAFVPSKAVALPGKLPQNALPYDNTAVLKEVQNALSEPVSFVDFKEVLRAHEAEYTYYKTDHHWTSLGAYYAYAELMQTLSLTPQVLDTLQKQVVSSSFQGSDYDKLQLGTTADEIWRYTPDSKVDLLYSDGEHADSLYDAAALATKNQYDYFLGGNDAVIQIQTGTKNGKTLLLIKDSYSNSLVPFFAAHYERIVMLDLRYMTDDVSAILEEEQPNDLFVIFNTENFMQDGNMDLLDVEK